MNYSHTFWVLLTYFEILIWGICTLFGKSPYEYMFYFAAFMFVLPKISEVIAKGIKIEETTKHHIE